MHPTLAGLAAPWLHVPPIIAAVLLIAGFAAHSRGVGAGVPGARSAGSLALVVLCHGLAGLPGAIMALGWAISRAQDFKKDAATPHTKKDFHQAAARQVYVGIAAFVCALMGHWPIVPATVLFVAVFLALADYSGDSEEAAEAAGVGIKRAVNVRVELGQGAAMGLAVWAGLILTL